MQIHELNNFTGTLGSGAYLAVDDGNDTGKLSTQQLLAATEARIDNIIAGPAPSAQEVTDARLGADGVTYSSLGTAIRSQVTDLKSDFENLSNTHKDSSTIKTRWEQGSLSSGTETVRSNRIRTPYIYIDNYESITITSESGYVFEVDFYNSSKSYTSYLGWSNERTFDKSSGAYVRLIFKKSNDADIIPSEASGNITIIGAPSLAKRFRDVAKISTYEKTNLQDESAWELGSLSSSGEERSSNTRIRSTFKSVLTGDVVYFLFNQEISSPYYYLEVIAYDSDFNVLSASGWKDEMVILQHDGYIRLNARKRDDSAISSADLSDMASKIYFNHQPINKDKEFNDGDTIKAVNHRGWHEAPENTLVAYKQSFNHGFRYVETDVRFTSDNVIVCLHDATINRTARNMDGSAIDETVNINDITYSEALGYDFGIWKGAEYAGTTIPTLSEFLTLCRNLNLRPYIDIGSTPEPSKAQIQSIVDAVISAGLSGKATYLCGVLKFGTWIVEKDPCARIGLVTSLNEKFCKYCYTYLTGKNTAFMDTQNSYVDNTTVARLKQYSLPVEIWTINDTDVIDAMDSYISGVTSDSVNAATYLKNKERGQNIYIAPSIEYGRAINLVGGYSEESNKIIVQLNFESNYTASNSPRILGTFPIPENGYAALQCIERDSNAEAIRACGCSLINDDLFIDNVESGLTYIINGQYYK